MAYRNLRNLWTLIFTCVFCCVADSSAEAQSIDWRKDLKKAARESEIYGKPVLLYLSTDWCHFCRKMEGETFADSEVGAKVSSDLIAVRLDGEKHRSIVRKFGVRGFPMSIVLDSRMKVLAEIRGYRQIPQFLGCLLYTSDAADE